MGMSLALARRPSVLMSTEGSEKSSLRVYPLRYAQGPAEIRERLLERGRKFMEVAQVKHMHYKGVTISGYEEVDSQVIIDFEQTILHNPDWIPHIGEDADDRRIFDLDFSDFENSPRNVDLHCGLDLCCGGEAIYDDTFVDVRMKDEFLKKNPLVVTYARPRAVIAEGSCIRDEELVLLTKRVFGFILTSRR